MISRMTAKMGSILVVPVLPGNQKLDRECMLRDICVISSSIQPWLSLVSVWVSFSFNVMFKCFGF